jgi:hypothetical protein
MREKDEVEKKDKKRQEGMISRLHRCTGYRESEREKA